MGHRRLASRMVLFPGAPLVALAIAVYTTVPVLVFARWRGWPFYPGAAFRLFVVRPFWYTQILLPLVAGMGLIGIAIGLAFGYPILVGSIFGGADVRRRNGCVAHRLRRFTQVGHATG